MGSLGFYPSVRDSPTEDGWRYLERGQHGHGRFDTSVSGCARHEVDDGSFLTASARSLSRLRRG